MFHEHPTRTLLILLAGLLAAAALTYLFGINYVSLQQPTPIPAVFPADAPTPRPQDYVAAQKGFQYLVSYINSGFTPTTLVVNKGETVRFTNNTSAPLQLTLAGAQPPVLDRGEYFEYTFTGSGTFNYSDGSGTGSVTVQ